LSTAVFSEPNSFQKVHNVPTLSVPVHMGQILDGVNGMLRNRIQVSEEAPVDVAQVLKENDADIVVSFLPSGVDKASEFYVEEALKAGCGFINAAPTQIASNDRYAERFEKAGLPLVGDDVMGQIGGTILHKNLMEFLSRRGVKVLNAYELDVGGGTETYNTLEPSRRTLKRDIKTEAIKSSLPYEANIVAGTTDYVDFLGNSRASYFWIEGRYFLNTPVKIDIYLRATDAPNSGMIIMGSIRAAKLAMDRGIGGSMISICAYGYKRPPVKASTSEAEEWFNEFMQGKRER